MNCIKKTSRKVRPLWYGLLPFVLTAPQDAEAVMSGPVTDLDMPSPSQNTGSALPEYKMSRIGNIIIPGAFGQAMREGLELPIVLHYADTKVPAAGSGAQKIAKATLVLKAGVIEIKTIDLLNDNDGAWLSQKLKDKLGSLRNVALDNNLSLNVSEDATLQLELKSLTLALAVKTRALSLNEQPRSNVLGPSSVQKITSTLDWNLGVYNGFRSGEQTHTSSYLSLNNLVSRGEHHLNLNGSVYGTAQQAYRTSLYRAMYEHDADGYRFAAGMVDSWNLQSLGSISGIDGGKIFGVSFGNQSSSQNQIDNMSLTPVEVFLPSAGEVHIKRDGKLLSIQNFPMGSFEVDTSTLPWGNYSVEIEVIIDGKVTATSTQNVNKMFSRRGRNAQTLRWQTWGGMLKRERWRNSKGESNDTWITGLSASSLFAIGNGIGWTASAYGFANVGVTEGWLDFPVTEKLNLTLQSLQATDASWRLSPSASLQLTQSLNLWANREKSSAGNRLSLNSSDYYATGGTLNLGGLIPRLGILNASYNHDRQNNNKYYNVNFTQNILSGRYGNLNMRLGMQRYVNQYNSNAGKYISFDFSMPIGSAIGVGLSHQNGYSTANISAQKRVTDSIINATGVNVSRAIGGDTGLDKTLSGNAYANFQGKYATGSFNISSSAQGYINSNLVAQGEVAMSGGDIAMGGMNSGNGAGVIVKTAIDEGSLTARINGQRVRIDGKSSYIPLSPYQTYQLEIMNDRNSLSSFDITHGRKETFTLYPGNVAVLNPKVKQRVTVFGKLISQSGQLLTHTPIHNHIGQTVTNEQGEFVIDVDKQQPFIYITDALNQTCKSTLDIKNAQGVKWVGEINCLQQSG